MKAPFGSAIFAIKEEAVGCCKFLASEEVLPKSPKMVKGIFVKGMAPLA